MIPDDHIDVLQVQSPHCSHFLLLFVQRFHCCCRRCCNVSLSAFVRSKVFHLQRRKSLRCFENQHYGQAYMQVSLVLCEASYPISAIPLYRMVSMDIFCSNVWLSWAKIFNKRDNNRQLLSSNKLQCQWTQCDDEYFGRVENG